MICSIATWIIQLSPGGALIVTALLIGQFALMPKLLREPRAKAAWYNATGISLYVTGMMISAVAIRPEIGLLP
jgi:chlorophyll synthase